MNQKKMQVLYIEQTGHILAAFTRTAEGESLLDVKGLAGTDLIVRNENDSPAPLSVRSEENLFVPIDLLKAEIINLNENAFVMPFNFMVGGGEANDLGSVSAPSLLPPPGTQFDLNGSSITIDNEVPVSEETKVWAQVQERAPSSGSDPIRRIVAGVIKPLSSGIGDGQTVNLVLKTRPDEQPAPIPTLPGAINYSVIVLVAGKPAGFTTVSL